jgi:hypothetical protein
MDATAHLSACQSLPYRRHVYLDASPAAASNAGIPVPTESYTGPRIHLPAACLALEQTVIDTGHQQHDATVGHVLEKLDVGVGGSNCGSAAASPLKETRHGMLFDPLACWIGSGPECGRPAGAVGAGHVQLRKQDVADPAFSSPADHGCTRGAAGSAC